MLICSTDLLGCYSPLPSASWVGSSGGNSLKFKFAFPQRAIFPLCVALTQPWAWILPVQQRIRGNIKAYFTKGLEITENNHNCGELHSKCGSDKIQGNKDLSQSPSDLLPSDPQASTNRISLTHYSSVTSKSSENSVPNTNMSAAKLNFLLFWRYCWMSLWKAVELLTGSKIKLLHASGLVVESLKSPSSNCSNLLLFNFAEQRQYFDPQIAESKKFYFFSWFGIK